MALIVLCSAKGSPGVTTTSLALTLVWPRPVLLVEADPAGGDVMAGYLRGQVRCDRGLLQLAIAARHGRLADEFDSQLINLNRHGAGSSRLLLPGLTNPYQAATIAPAWPEIVEHLTGLAGDGGGDVLVDVGRLAAVAEAPWHLIKAADHLIMVLRTSLRSVSATEPVLTRLNANEVARPAGLMVIDGGDYQAREVADRLEAPLVAALPWQPRDAAALAEGHGATAGRSTLLRAARTASRATAQAAVHPVQVAQVAAA